MNDILVKLRFVFPSLPRAEKAVVEFLMLDPGKVTNLTIAELSQLTSSSEASIVRLCKRLGFSGFSDMKKSIMLTLVEGVTEELKEEELEVHRDDSMEMILQKVFQSNVKILTDTLSLVSEDYSRALDEILKAKSIHFFGVGDAYVVGELAQMKFCRLGIRCTAHSDIMLQLTTASILEKGDVAIAISYSGRSRSVIEAMRIAKECGATTICITKSNKSPLLKHTDINLFTATTDSSIGKYIVAKRVAEQAILEALYLGLLKKSEKNFEGVLRKTAIAIDSNKM